MTDENAKPNKKILIVDDDPTITEVMKTKLEFSGYEAKVEENSTHAIETAVHFAPDLIILDLMMTRLSGEELLKTLKQNETLQAVPVLVFTNKDLNENDEKLANLGATRSLIKANTSLQELVDVVGELVAPENS